MRSLVMLQSIDLEEVVNIDSEVIGNDSRRTYIQQAMDEARCIGVKDENTIVGYLIFDTYFFECSFISLVIVKPSERRKGYATSLIQHFISIAPTTKIFSSTNQSNIQMHEVFKKNGFIQSGYVDNLDEGDPEIIYFRNKKGEI